MSDTGIKHFQNLFQVKQDKRLFVGMTTESDLDAKEQDVILSCIESHRKVLATWLAFCKETAINPLCVIPSTIAVFREKSVLRYSGYIFDQENLANQFKSFAKSLIEYVVPEQTFLTMTSYGPVEKKDDAWRLLLGFCIQNKVELDKSWSYESYPINESVTKDTSIWETEIFCPMLTPLTEVPQQPETKLEELKK